MFFRYEHIDRRGVIRSKGEGENDEHEFVGGLHAQVRIGREQARSNVERAFPSIRNPSVIQSQQFAQAMHKVLFWNGGHRKPLGGSIHPTRVFPRTKNNYLTLRSAMGFET